MLPCFAFVPGAPVATNSMRLSLLYAFSRFIPSAAKHICACTFAEPKYRALARCNLRFIVPKACSSLKRMVLIFALNVSSKR